MRCSPLFEYAPNILALVAIIGAVTSFFAATSGAFQNDLKRVIAYSTCSQLGYMIFACGISSYSVTMFHPMNHAFFKALLFLSAGSIIHAMHDEQDMRKMGGLNRILPFTYTMTLIGSFALIGFPFLTGYYSKDFILEVACSKFHFSGNLAYWLGTISVSFTTFYSYRLLFMTFINKTNLRRSSALNAHEGNIILGFPLFLLALGSLFIGYLSKDMIIGLGSTFWGNSIFILGENVSFIEAEFLPYHIRASPLSFSHLGIFFAYNTAHVVSNPDNSAISSFQKSLLFHRFGTKPFIIKISTFFAKSWHFDNLYNRFIVQKFLNFGYNTSFRLSDAGWIAYLGPYGIANIINHSGKLLSQLQTGFVYHYAFIIVATIVAILISLFSWDSFLFGEVHGLYFISALTFVYLSFEGAAVNDAKESDSGR